MHSSAVPDLSSAHLWARLLAVTHADAAWEALHDVLATLSGLVDATGWESEGVRQLHGAVVRALDDTVQEITRLRGISERLGAVGAR